MGTVGCCGVKFFVFVMIMGLVAAADPTKSTKRRVLQNVIRVGKKHGGDNDLLDFLKENRRYGRLLSFPRLGRSPYPWANNDSPENKRDESKSGLWFGPRIGRSPPKIEDLENLKAWAYILVKDGNHMIPQIQSNKQQQSKKTEDVGQLDLNELDELLQSYN